MKKTFVNSLRVLEEEKGADYLKRRIYMKKVNTIKNRYKKKELWDLCVAIDGFDGNYKKFTKETLAKFIIKNNIQATKSAKVGRPVGSLKKKYNKGDPNKTIEFSDEKMFYYRKMDVFTNWGDDYKKFKIIKQIKNFPKLYERNLAFIYCNNDWSGVFWNEELAHLFSHNERMEIKDNLPHRTPLCEKVFSKILGRREHLRKFFEDHKQEKVPILTKYTKNPCKNIWCLKCTWRMRYMLIWNNGRSCFYIKVDIKGKHDPNFKAYVARKDEFPLTIAYRWLCFSKDDFKGSVRDFRPFAVQKFKENFLMTSSYIQERERIHSKRSRMKTDESGTYKDGLNSIICLLENKQYPRFKLWKREEDSAWLCVIIDHKKNIFPDEIQVIYFDGTFKSKYLNSLHYNILFMATVDKFGRLIFLGFCFSFSNTHDEWVQLYDGISTYYNNLGINFRRTSHISDMGSGELKFAKVKKLKRHYWCWFHVSEIFEPFVSRHAKKYEVKIWKFIILIYSAKSRPWRNKLVEALVLFIDEKKLGIFKKKLSPYLTVESLDKWSCLCKLSTLLGHSNNYIEREFGEITTSVRMRRIPDVFQSIHNRIDDVNIEGKLEGNSKKMEICEELRSKGIDHWKKFEVEEIGSSSQFNVESATEKKKWYKVNMKHFYCTCDSFNTIPPKKMSKSNIGAKYNKKRSKKKSGNYGKICKHIGAVVSFVLAYDLDLGAEEMKKLDKFAFWNMGRMQCTSDKDFKEYLKICRFPVTIGETEFKIIFK